MDREVYLSLARVEDRHWWFRARRTIATRILQTLQLPANAAILEVGSGTGGNLSMLSQFGRLFAMELNAEARALSDQRGIVRAEAGMLPDRIPFGDQQFDVITAFDVLEHIEPDFETLVALHARLAVGGKLITVPAFPFLWSAHDESHHHKRRYTLQPLVSLIERAGYQVLLATYCNFWLFPIVAAARLLDRLKGGSRYQNSAQLSIPSDPLNRLLEAIFASERHLHGIIPFPFGVSIVLLAEKS